MINWFVSKYRTRLDELTKERYIPENDSFGVAPPPEFIEEVGWVVRNKLKNLGILRKVLNPFTMNFVPGIRHYKDHILIIYSQ